MFTLNHNGELPVYNFISQFPIKQTRTEVERGGKFLIFSWVWNIKWNIKLFCMSWREFKSHIESAGKNEQYRNIATQIVICFILFVGMRTKEKLKKWSIFCLHVIRRVIKTWTSSHHILLLFFMKIIMMIEAYMLWWFMEVLIMKNFHFRHFIHASNSFKLEF